MKGFEHEFGLYVCDGDRITCEVDGFTCHAFTEHDTDTTPYEERQGGLVVREAWPEDAIKSWERNDWDFCGVCVIVERNGVRLTEAYAHATWGVERNLPGADNTYLREVANNQLHDALADAKRKLAELAQASEAQADPWGALEDIANGLGLDRDALRRIAKAALNKRAKGS